MLGTYFKRGIYICIQLQIICPVSTGIGFFMRNSMNPVVADTDGHPVFRFFWKIRAEKTGSFNRKHPKIFHRVLISRFRAYWNLNYIPCTPLFPHLKNIFFWSLVDQNYYHLVRALLSNQMALNCIYLIKNRVNLGRDIKSRHELKSNLYLSHRLA